MQRMDAHRRTELERLRARAYGPDADIAEDPAAIERLRELEDLERVEQPRLPEAEVLAATTEASGPVPDAASADDPTPGEGPAVKSRPLLRSRRRVWIAALGIALALALTSAATAAGVSFTAVDRTAGIAQTDALVADPDAELGAAGYLGFDPSQTRGYADYYGLTVFEGRTQIDSEGNIADCLLVLDTRDLLDGDGGRTGGGVRTGSCGAGPFPASVEMIVTPSFPEAFRTRYPVGTAVQFVRGNGSVGVFTAAS